MNHGVWINGTVPQTIPQLHENIVQESTNLSQNYIRRHVTLMRRHCQNVINIYDGHTGYWNEKISLTFIILQHWLFTQQHMNRSCVLHLYLLWNKVSEISHHVSQLYCLKMSTWSDHYWQRYETIYTCTLIRCVKCRENALYSNFISQNDKINSL